MAHFKSKKSRRSVKCAMCTQFRWLGNSKASWTKGARTAKANRNRVHSDELA